jgi:hypothetical protein
LLHSIEVAKRDKTPRKALEGRPGDDRKVKVRKARRAGDRTRALKEMESSRKDELDPKRSRDGRQARPQGRLETTEPGRKGTTQKVPDLQAHKTSRSHELHERRHGPR